MKILVTIVIVFLIPVLSLADSGARFLAVEAGARPVGMGGAFTSITSDPYSAAYNPAAVFGVEKLSGSFGHNTYWQGTQIHSGYVIFEKHSIAFNAGIQFGEVGDIEGRGDIPTEEPLYLFELQDISFKTGFAFRIKRIITVGLSAGWVFEKIDSYRGYAVNADLGLLVNPVERLYFGLSALYLGQKLKLNVAEYDLPTSYRFGVSYHLDNFLPAFDIVNEDGDTHLHVGAEFKTYDKFFLRAGYRTGYDTKDLSAGVGFAHRNLRIDYAYQPYSDILDDSHLINLTFTL